MRFENLGYGEKRAFLQRLYKRLNRVEFAGQLKPIDVDIENAANLFAGFSRGYPIEKGKTIILRKIFISYEGEQWIIDQKTQKAQAYIITMLLLHEMVHQYCDENGIDDGNHNETWQKIADEHGLHSVYEDGVLKEENLKPIMVPFFVDNIRIY